MYASMHEVMHTYYPIAEPKAHVQQPTRAQQPFHTLAHSHTHALAHSLAHSHTHSLTFAHTHARPPLRQALKRYQLLFRHLFYTKHVERQLSRIWLDHQGAKRGQLSVS